MGVRGLPRKPEDESRKEEKIVIIGVFLPPAGPIRLLEDNKLLLFFFHHYRISNRRGLRQHILISFLCLPFHLIWPPGFIVQHIALKGKTGNFLDKTDNRLENIAAPKGESQDEDVSGGQSKPYR